METVTEPVFLWLFSSQPETTYQTRKCVFPLSPSRLVGATSNMRHLAEVGRTMASRDSGQVTTASRGAN